jgi:outer membrane protein TolC
VVGLDIQIPLFSSGARGARVGQARLDLEKARNSKRYLAEGLKLGLMQARLDFFNAFGRSKSTEENVKLARKIYNKTLEKYRQGTATSLELAQTHNQYLTAESNYTAAVVELLNAKIQLDKALNQL